MVDINNPLGLEVFGLPIHPDWTCLLPPSRLSQVVVYCNRQITACFHVAVNHTVFNHPNIFLFSVFNERSRTTLSFINLYNNPNRDASPSLRNCIPTLLQFLLLVTSLQLCKGDFNLHCSYWDADC